jgi:hypothetical protein
MGSLLGTGSLLVGCRAIPGVAGKDLSRQGPLSGFSEDLIPLAADDHAIAEHERRDTGDAQGVGFLPNGVDSILVMLLLRFLQCKVEGAPLANL